MTIQQALTLAADIAHKFEAPAILYRLDRGYDAREALPFDRLDDEDIVAFVTPSGKLIFDHGDAS